MQGYTSVNALTVLCSTCASTVALLCTCTYMYMQLRCCLDIHVLFVCKSVCFMFHVVSCLETETSKPNNSASTDRQTI